MQRKGGMQKFLFGVLMFLILRTEEKKDDSWKKKQKNHLYKCIQLWSGTSLGVQTMSKMPNTCKLVKRSNATSNYPSCLSLSFFPGDHTRISRGPWVPAGGLRFGVAGQPCSGRLPGRRPRQAAAGRDGCVHLCVSSPALTFICMVPIWSPFVILFFSVSWEWDDSMWAIQ